MNKENKNIKIEQGKIPEIVSGSSTIAVMQQRQALKTLKQVQGLTNKIQYQNVGQALPDTRRLPPRGGRGPVRADEGEKVVSLSPWKNQTRRAFTLIELLVVILIVAILAAIALPQYQKAVTKARAVQLQTLLTTAVNASNQYYLQHGTYPTSFDELDVTLPLTTLPRSQSTCDHNLIPTSVKRGKDVELVIYQNNTYHNFISAHFIDGKYKCAGFVHYNYTNWGADWVNGKTFCAEYFYNRNCGEYNCQIFCKQIMGKTRKGYVQLINLFE